jgi:hypothetical protein
MYVKWPVSSVVEVPVNVPVLVGFDFELERVETNSKF